MNLNDSIIENQHLKSRIVYSGLNAAELISHRLQDDFQVSSFDKLDELESFLNAQSLFTTPEIIMVEIHNTNSEKVFDLIGKIKNTPLTCGLIVILIAIQHNKSNREKAIELKVHDYYDYPFDVSELDERLKFLIKFKLIKTEIQSLSHHVRKKYKMPIGKRLFDITLSAMTLVTFLPVFFVVALLIKLESKGPIIYKSKRAGSGYKIFDFYKFRSMGNHADKQLDKLVSQNQYGIGDLNSEAPVFVKIKNDPRITRVGKFLRKTSIDELPQLFNVLKGDMSIVGNRPLPLYEAEQLTSNEWCTRFLGPAGITGLWQITKRGKEEMSNTERRKLDNYYVDHSSLLFDLKIIVRTIPAMLQKENV